MRLDTGHRGRGLREPGQVEAGAAAEVEDVAAAPVGDGWTSRTRAGRRGRRLGSRPRRSRCGARCSGWGACPQGAAAAEGSAQIRTRPRGVCTCAAMIPGVPLGAAHSTFTSSSGASTVSPSHSLTRCGVARDLQAGQRVGAVGVEARVQLGRHLPLDEERQLRVCDQAVDADLLPAQLGAVGTVPAADDRLATEPALDHGDVVDRDDPAQPAAATGGAGADGLAERRLVGRRVVEHVDDLEVGVVGQRQHHVAGAEARVHAAVEERGAEQLADAFGRGGQAVGSGGEGQVVETHEEIVNGHWHRDKSGVGVS